MKRIIQIANLLCLSIISPLLLHAQEKVIVEDETSNGVIIVTIDKAGDEIVRIINESQLPYFHDPKAPRFLLMDKKGKFALGIGGYVCAIAEYDFGGIVDYIDFIPADISASPKIRNQFQMDASMASIFLKLVGHTDLLGDFIVYTAGNFRGAGKTFQLRNAYITFHDITIGYTYGGFMDASAVPTTVDFQGPNGAALYRATQISYHFNRLENFQFNASIEMPQVKGSTNNEFEIGRQRIPDFTLSAQYNWNSNSHIRIAGIMRNMTYTSELHEKALSATGYGIQASTTFNITPQWQFYGQATYGKGIGSYLNDISTLNADLVADPENESRMQILPMLGWYAGIRYNITSNLFMSSTYSLSRLYSQNNFPNHNTDEYHYGQYFAINTIWNVTSDMQMGIEYLRGQRNNFDNSRHHANRLNLSVQYSF